MPLEIDHLIICCDRGAPEGEALIAHGLLEGSSNVHAGQGSANRRFFFENAYLELLWIEDPPAAKREPARRTRLWERWRRRDASACPFGIAFRPLDPAAETLPPFPTWAYHAPYLPAQVSIGIALATPLSEPEFLYLPFATRPDAKGREPIAHPAGLRRLTGVRVGLPPSSTHSQAAQAVAGLGLLAWFDAPAYVMELTFGEGAAERSIDFRPALPLLVHR